MSNFGKCCKDLNDAITTPPSSFFRTEENGIFFLTIGFMVTDDGRTGWFDQAVIYCPFCGTKLQDRDEIKAKTEAAEPIN